MDLLLGAIGQVLAWANLQWLLVGVVAGLFIGLVPGLGGITFVSIALPFTFVMDTSAAFGLLIGFMAVGTTSDTIPAVLIAVPGSSSGQATVLDGHAMARQGQAARALGASFTAAVLGGIVGAAVLLLSVPIVRPLVLSFGYPEFFMLALWGISMVARLSSGAVVKGLIMGGVGLLLASVGSDARSGFPRWTFGTAYLLDGVDLAVLAMAFFAVPELVSLAVRGTAISEVPPITGLVRGQLRGALDALRNWGTVLRGGIIGALVSVIPGMGGSVSGWIAYGVTVQTSRDKSRFGRGDVRGVIGPDSASNASDGGHLIPTLAFGVPGSGGMAFLLAVFTAHGIQTGTNLLTTRLDVIYFFVVGLVVANIIGAIICFFAANQLAKLSYAPFYFLNALFIPILFLSAFQSSSQLGDILLLVLMAVVAYALRQFGWPRPPLLLGFVLSRTLEANFASSLSIYGGMGWVFRPLVLALAALILIGLFGPAIWRGLLAVRSWFTHEKVPWGGALAGGSGRRRPDRPGQHAGGGVADVLAGGGPVVLADGAPAVVLADGGTAVVSAGRRRLNWFGSVDLALTLVLIVGIGIALWQATSWPNEPKTFPLAIGTVTVALLAVQLLNRLRHLHDEQFGGSLFYEMPADIADVGTVVVRRSAKEFAWLVGLLAAIWGLGLALVMPFFPLAYLRVVGRVGWRITLIATAGFTLFEWVLFEKLAHLYWYRGPLLNWLGSMGILIGG